MRPLILIDVDGVLNRLGRKRGVDRPWFQAEGMCDGETYPLVLNAQHGPKLLQLAEDTGAELVWATTWQEEANTQIAPLVGLPTLPAIDVERHRQLLGSDIPGVCRKTPYVAEYVGDRPFVWFDDDTTKWDQDYLSERCGGPFRLVYVDRWDGLTDLDFADATRWFASLAGGAR
mgnify:CR=1 FL=1